MVLYSLSLTLNLFTALCRSRENESCDNHVTVYSLPWRVSVLCPGYRSLRLSLPRSLQASGEREWLEDCWKLKKNLEGLPSFSPSAVYPSSTHTMCWQHNHSDYLYLIGSLKIRLTVIALRKSSLLTGRLWSLYSMPRRRRTISLEGCCSK